MKILTRKKSNPPLCACGCGQCTLRGSNGSWNKFLRGHNSKSMSNNMGFKPGNKHGRGRPQGSRNKVTVAAEKLFESESGVIARNAVEMALSGNVAMIKLILERVVPIKKSVPVKLEGLPVVDNAAASVQLTGFLLNAMAAGKISPVDGEAFSRVAEKHINALQVNDLESRLKQLEDKIEQGTTPFSE